MSSSPATSTHDVASPGDESHHQDVPVDNDQPHMGSPIVHEEISLERLVEHLLASKRSLSSISTVWRANEIVTSARAALEKSVKLTARTGYLRAGIADQAKLLYKARESIEGVYNEGEKDFKVNSCLAGIYTDDQELIGN